MFLLLVACAAPDTIADAETAWITQLSAETSGSIPTAIEIQFSTAAEGVGWVEVDGIATGASEPGTEHTHIVYGPPISDLSVIAVVEVDGQRHESEAFTVTTGQLLPETPTLDVTIDKLSSHEGAEELILVAHLYGTPTSWTIISDLSGQILWAISQESQGLSIQPMLERGAVMENLTHYNDLSSSSLRTVDLMGNILSERSTPGAHHFFELVDGEPLWIRADSRRVDAQLVVGDALIWGDEEIFSTWDHINHYTSTPFTPSIEDWTHANWIHHNPERDTFLMSLAKQSTIIELSRGGEPLQILGGTNSHVFIPDDDHPHHPHGAHWLGPDLVVMTTTNEQSTVRQYKLDGQEMVAVNTLGADNNFHAHVLGEAQPLKNSMLLVSWGSVGVVQVLSSDNEVLWEAHSELGHFISQVFMLPTRFSPAP